MNTKDIFNPRTLNIFVDASIMHLPNESIGCPGAVCVATQANGDTYVIDQLYYFERYATNNSAEIKAVSLGVSKALQYRYGYGFDTINLFSDSKICIHGLREWLFNWIHCVHNNVMYSSSGTPVANQNTFASIANTIVMNNLNINLYHQKGHVSVNNEKHINNALEVFKRENFIAEKVKSDLIRKISEYNNNVDIVTGVMLDKYYKELEKCKPFEKTDTVMSFKMDKFDVNKYKELINYKDKKPTTRSRRR